MKKKKAGEEPLKLNTDFETALKILLSDKADDKEKDVQKSDKPKEKTTK